MPLLQYANDPILGALTFMNIGAATIAVMACIKALCAVRWRKKRTIWLGLAVSLLYLGLEYHWIKEIDVSAIGTFTEYAWRVFELCVMIFVTNVSIGHLDCRDASDCRFLRG